MNIAIITGASSGLGKEFAIQLAGIVHKTDEIWLLSRNKETLEALADELNLFCVGMNKSLIVRAIPTDLTDPADLSRFSEILWLKEAKISVLINCAGTGSYGLFSYQSESDITNMLALNVTALTRMTQICLPYMRRGSKIIQVASAAAFCSQRKFAVYAATKAYVYSFGRSLTKELKMKGIYVTTVCPGTIDTPFLTHAYGNLAKQPFYKKLITAKADKVVHRALIDSKKHKKLSVYGMPMKALYVLTRGLIV